MMSKNQTVTLRTLKKEMEGKGLSISKPTLLKVLHEVGFRYCKIDDEGSKDLLERKDLDEKRAKYLHENFESKERKKNIL